MSRPLGDHITALKRLRDFKKQQRDRIQEQQPTAKSLNFYNQEIASLSIAIEYLDKIREVNRITDGRYDELLNKLLKEINNE